MAEEEEQPAAEAVVEEEAVQESDEYEKGPGSGPFGMREITLFPGFFLNPIVSIGGAVGLWIFVIVTIADPEKSVADFGSAQSDVTRCFTWLYIASQDWWLFFLIPLCYKFGHVKLGADDDKPEYTDASYFCMVFCAGVAIGLIFYGASEPLYHLNGSHRYQTGFVNENQLSQDAINITIYHWGLQAWVVYALTAVTMGFLSYKQGLPLCFRTVLAPLFGRACWGWFGDLIDIVTILTIVMGLTTSLGLGAGQIVEGLQRLEIVDTTLDESGITRSRCWVIGVVTIGATCSVVSGLNYGIKTLSQLAFVLANFLLCVVFFLDMPWHLLNLMVQSFGYHFQNLIEIGFYTDAFAQLTPGRGGATDGKGANPSWMDWWTIFYWGWWIAWAPFVGTFLARISKGRTIFNVIAYSLSVPFFYALVWFCTFGGAALRMHKRALWIQSTSLELFGDASHFLHTSETFRPASAGACYDVPETLPFPYNTSDMYSTNALVSPVCVFSSGNGDGYWFDLMSQYHNLGTFLSVISVLVIILFFITSSDSGSLVVDLIAANGKEAHVIQRVFWALTEGAVAIALVGAGGAKSVKALQAVSIIAGLPFTIILMYMCTSLWRALQVDQGGMAPRGKRLDWNMPLYGGILDVIEFVFTLGKFPVSANLCVSFIMGMLCPPVILWTSLRGLAAQQTKQQEKGQEENPLISSAAADGFMCIAAAGTFFAFVIFQILLSVHTGLGGVGWACYVGFATILAAGRHNIRRRYELPGTGFEDFFVCLLFYPQALAQMDQQVKLEIPPEGTQLHGKDLDVNNPDGML